MLWSLARDADRRGMSFDGASPPKPSAGTNRDVLRANLAGSDGSELSDRKEALAVFEKHGWSGLTLLAIKRWTSVTSDDDAEVMNTGPAAEFDLGSDLQPDAEDALGTGLHTELDSAALQGGTNEPPVPSTEATVCGTRGESNKEGKEE